MRPEFNSRRLFGITRSKGKMYELDLPSELHLSLPADDVPEALFVLTVGNLGDAAAALNEDAKKQVLKEEVAPEDLQFAASFFDAFLASRFRDEISHEVLLLAASAYYLSHRPGSSLVLAKQLSTLADEDLVSGLLRWILQGNWSLQPQGQHLVFGDELRSLAQVLATHFLDGSGSEAALTKIDWLRAQAYAKASARDVLYIDLISAIARLRLSHSAWTMLPACTNIPLERWAPIIGKSGFPRELWPSQIRLAEAGIFAGLSGVIQMPTSAGKTKSVEIVLRSAFLVGRVQLAVVVAPFRALCREISASLQAAFKSDGVTVNELSDVLQRDFLREFAEIVEPGEIRGNRVLVLTPEKFLYVLRQAPEIVSEIGTVIYDEGHQFDTGSRGITYELLLTQIKTLLPKDAQTLLISAVIQNAQAIGTWLIGEQASVIDGVGLLPTTRAYAFASWIDHHGQLMFFESTDFKQRDYFVPRAIEQQELRLLHRNEKERQFPSRKPKETARDVSLYLGIRLASKGACAIFCGRKDTARGMADRIVEIYRRGYSGKPPAAHANGQELARLAYLLDRHFGSDSILSQAARLGTFVHHNNTPQGLRLAIEYAMQQGMICLVACTSTLAQGVNLPIRYLIVSGTKQGEDRIRARDFQNLVGRAGRAGMHTEGVIIFSDPSVYDRRNMRAERWRFRTSCDLLSGVHDQATGSSLLGMVAPIKSVDGRSEMPVPTDTLWQLIYATDEQRMLWAAEMVLLDPRFTVNGIVGELLRRRAYIVAIESYLMANRGSAIFPEYALTVEQLCKATLAHHLATDEQRTALVVLFRHVAQYIDSRAPDTARQAVYGRTLLGVENARSVEQWVIRHREALLGLDSAESWLRSVWPLLVALNADKFFQSVEPPHLSFWLASWWMRGNSYKEIFDGCRDQKGTKPWGNGRRKLTEGDILEFFQNTLAFECSLVLAAVGEFLFGLTEEIGPEQAIFQAFQKALSYGLPDDFSIAAFEYGFADRMLAQHLRDALNPQRAPVPFRFTARLATGEVRQVLSLYPSYFETVLERKGFSRN